uniref:Uncharacterized protein n=1 Tax=Rhizophora mucronata TaxID=61149 RepID=A0A2P2NUH7_RHIMU
MGWRVPNICGICRGSKKGSQNGLVD